MNVNKRINSWGRFRMQRRAFTLIEVIVSMGLAMGVLVTLMGFYAYVSYLGKLGKNQEKMVFQTLYIQSRLSEVLPQAVPSYEAGKDEKKEIKSEYNFFSTHINGMPSLTFLFSGGASTDPLFSGNCLGRLYVNTHRQFCFATFPSPLQWHQASEIPLKMEILLEGVDSVNFAFFVPLEVKRDLMWESLSIARAGKTKADPIAGLPQGQWVAEWQNDYRKIPPLVRLEVVKGKDTIKFVYPLPKSEYMVVYE